VDDLNKLGINAQNELFWDGKRVEIRQRLRLSNTQKLAAALVTVFALLGGLGGFLSGLNDGSQFLCARGVHLLGCPANPTPP
jgi:hypothetical protein